MFKYVYVTIENEKFFSAKFTRHRELIDEYSKKGYRYVGYVPTRISDYGKFKEIDLIFEIQE